MLRVRDTGVGIAPEFLPRIFDLFTQAERSLDRSQGGLGIGLALVQRLVEMHGGTVTASSALGQGSEFVVRLPVVSPPQPQVSSPPTEKTQPTGPSLRVLVVDDNVDTVTTLALLVKESGHDVRTAYDGSAVLEAALDYRPNLVLLDIGLPGLNGFEVAKQLRQQSRSPEHPAGRHDRVRTRERPTAFTGGGVRSPPSQAGRFREGAANLGDRLGVISMMKTQGEIEAAICEGISRFEQECRGRGPKDIHAYLLGRFHRRPAPGFVDTRRTTTCQSPVREGEGLAQASTDPSDRNGETAPASDGPGRSLGVKVVSLHHDISTVTGEAFVVLTLAEPPSCRQRRQHSLALLREERNQGRGQLPLRFLRRGDRRAHRPGGWITPEVRRRLSGLLLPECHSRRD